MDEGFQNKKSKGHQPLEEKYSSLIAPFLKKLLVLLIVGFSGCRDSIKRITRGGKVATCVLIDVRYA